MTASDRQVPSTPQLLTIGDLRRLFQCGRTTAYARVREPGFPAPLVLSGSAHRWWQHEVLAWFEGHRVQRSTGVESRVVYDVGGGLVVDMGAVTA